MNLPYSLFYFLFLAFFFLFFFILFSSISFNYNQRAFLSFLVIANTQTDSSFDTFLVYILCASLIRINLEVVFIMKDEYRGCENENKELYFQAHHDQKNRRKIYRHHQTIALSTLFNFKQQTPPPPKTTTTTTTRHFVESAPLYSWVPPSSSFFFHSSLVWQSRWRKEQDNDARI